MRLTRSTIITLIAAGGLLAFSPALRAQDTNKAAKAADTKAPAVDAKAPPADGKGKKGGRGGPTLEQLTEQLKLTDEQKPKVKVAFDERTKKMADLAPEDRQTKRPVIQDEYSKKMKEILNADQFKTFEELYAARGGRGGGKKGAGAPAPAVEKKVEPVK